MIVDTPLTNSARIIVELLRVLYARATWSSTPMSLEEIRKVTPVLPCVRSHVSVLICKMLDQCMGSDFQTGQDHDPQDGWRRLTTLVSEILPNVIPEHGYPKGIGSTTEGLGIEIPDEIPKNTKLSFHDCLMKTTGFEVSTLWVNT